MPFSSTKYMKFRSGMHKRIGSLRLKTEDSMEFAVDTMMEERVDSYFRIEQGLDEVIKSLLQIEEELEQICDLSGAMPGLAGIPAAKSAVSDVDGERGVLEYRGIRVEELCKSSSYLETAYLLLFGHLPTRSALARWEEDIAHHRRLKYSIIDLMSIISGTSPSARAKI